MALPLVLSIDLVKGRWWGRLQPPVLDSNGGSAGYDAVFAVAAGADVVALQCITVLGRGSGHGESVVGEDLIYGVAFGAVGAIVGLDDNSDILLTLVRASEVVSLWHAVDVAHE